MSVGGESNRQTILGQMQAIHSAALLDRCGKIIVCGGNHEGQLGLGDTLPRNVFEVVNSEHVFARLASGPSHCAAITDRGELHTWGSDGDMSLGRVVEGTYCAIPKPVLGRQGFVQVAVGFRFTLALDPAGKVWGFGLNSAGQLGMPSLGGEESLVHAFPTMNPFLRDIIKIRTGYAHAFALDSKHDLWGFGHNGVGQLGLNYNSVPSSETPINITELYNQHASQVKMAAVMDVACGSTHTLIRDSECDVWSCGSNFCGELGRITYAMPSCALGKIHFLGSPKIARVLAGYSASYAITEEKDVFVWGSNAFGQLAVTHQVTVNYPYKNPTLSKARVTVCGDGLFLSFEGLAGVFACGRNDHSQLGLLQPHDSRLSLGRVDLSKLSKTAIASVQIAKPMGASTNRNTTVKATQWERPTSTTTTIIPIPTVKATITKTPYSTARRESVFNTKGTSKDTYLPQSTKKGEITMVTKEDDIDEDGLGDFSRWINDCAKRDITEIIAEEGYRTTTTLKRVDHY